jgi:outer membrane receptor protein involved in Fe transport
MLNPFEDRSNPDMVRSGNPDLKPEYINSLEAGYAKFWDNSSINASVFYKKLNNVINRMLVLDDNGVSHMFPQNQTSGESYGFELVGEYQLLKWWKLNGNASYFRNIIKGSDPSLSNSNYTYTGRLMSTMTLPKNFNIQLTGFYRGPMVMVSTRMKPIYAADLAIKKDFWNDKFTATIRVSDLFNTLKFRDESWGDNFTSNGWRQRESRIVYLGLSYKIGGGIKSKNKRSEDSNGNMEMDF